MRVARGIVHLRRRSLRGTGSWGRSYLLVAVALSVMVVAAAPAQDATPPGVRVSLVADSSELTVGDLVTISLIVSHPEDFTVVIPRLQRDWGPFEVRAQTSVQTVSLTDGTRTVAKQFRVTLFAPGTFETPDISVSVRGPDGTVVQVSPSPAQLAVNSVLASPDEELKDLRPSADLSTPFWERRVVLVLIVVAALTIAAGTAFHLYRRSRRADQSAAAMPDLRTPWEAANQELDRIARLDLPASGEMKEHYTLVSAALRTYLGATYLRDAGGRNAGEMSTEETSAGIRRSTLDYRRAGLLIELLLESDIVKFANHQPTAVRAREAATLVREFVELTAPLFSEKADNGPPVKLRGTP